MIGKNKFRLLSLTLNESKEFEEGIFQFYPLDNKRRANCPFTTLIIGPNGTGKSRLLKIIIEIFNDLYNYKSFGRTSFKFNQFYILEYYLDGEHYEIQNNREEIIVKRNNHNIDSYGFELPSKGIAAAYSLYEKFSPKESSFLDKAKRSSRYDNDFYEYLGIKTNRNYTFSSANINNSVDLITGAMSQNGFAKDLKSVFNVLGFIPKLSITYNVKRNKELFSGNLSIPIFNKILQDTRFKKAGFSYSSLENLKDASEDEARQVVESLNEIANVLGPKLELPIELIFEENSNFLFIDFMSILRF